MPQLKFQLILFLVISIFFSACEKSIDWELESLAEPRLVVEAILTNEDRIQEIRLSQTFDQLNDEAPQIKDAVVFVEANNLVFDFSPDPQNPGLYKSEDSFAILPNRVYSLNIDWDGELYQANSSLSVVTPMPPIFFAPIPNTDSVRLGDFVPPFIINQQSMYQVDVDWSHLSSDSLTKARIYLYTFNSIHISQLIPPAKKDVFFPVGSLVQVRKYGLNDDFAEYLRSKAIETEWSGTYFYSTADNLPSNISNNGLGFFSTCSVLQENLIAQ